MMRFAPCFVAAAMVASAALATPVPPGGSVTAPPGQAVSFGSPLTPPLNSPFVAATYTGTLVSTVYINDPQNPNGPGFLTFHYTLTNNAGSANALGRLSVNGYAGFLTDMTWQAPGNMAPIVEDRGGGAGDDVGFNFAGFLPGYSALLPGMTSMELIVHTNATQAGLNVASVIDGFTATVPTYSPVPTPGAGALLGAGLLAANRRRRA
jgi:hypothetical protein